MRQEPSSSGVTSSEACSFLDDNRVSEYVDGVLAPEAREGPAPAQGTGELPSWMKIRRRASRPLGTEDRHSGP